MSNCKHKNVKWQSFETGVGNSNNKVDLESSSRVGLISMGINLKCYDCKFDIDYKTIWIEYNDLLRFLKKQEMQEKRK